MTIRIPPTFYTLLPKLKSKLLFDDLPKWGIQNLKKIDKLNGKDPGYYYQKREIRNSDFVNHFYVYTPYEDNTKYMGSLGLSPTNADKTKTKFCVFDIDKPHVVEKAQNELLPLFDSYGIDYLIGWGINREKCHIWLFFDSISVITLGIFIKQCLNDIGADISKEWFEEIFGVNKLSNFVRLDGGYHLKQERVFPITYKGVDYSDTLDIVQSFVNCKVHTENEISKLIREVPIEEKKKQSKHQYRGYTPVYEPINLPLPMEGLPSLVKSCARQCQAINKAIRDVVDDEGLETPSGTTHDRGLALTGLATYNDFKLHTQDGKAWMEFLETEYRFRPSDSHQWGHTKITTENENKFAWSCKAWEEKFDSCQGCPFKDSIQNPKYFYYGKPIRTETVGIPNIVTLEDIWNKTFVEFKADVKHAVDNKLQKNFLLATSTGSRKSVTLGEMAADYAKQGKKILMAVPSAKLALEQKERLEAHGIKPFLLMSHRNIFGKQGEYPKDFQLADFDCPSFQEIQDLHDLGVSSDSYKGTYCQSCPLFNKCYYPNQYTQVQDTRYSVVIIQHTHIQCQEVIFELMRKQFDMLFIDESFIDITYTNVRTKPEELEVLSNIDFKWSVRLLNWLKGESPAKGILNPPKGELDTLYSAFKAYDLKWTIPEYIRFHNQGRKVHEIAGIEVIYELPKIPIKVFTDATPPIELLERLIGEPIHHIYGKNQVLDITSIHPENQIIQVLDESCSQNALSKNGRLEKLFADICYSMEYLYPDKKALITCYKGHITKFIQFALENLSKYPSIYKRLCKDPGNTSISNRITLYRMDKGVNDFWDYDLQFIIFALYGNQKLYREQMYKFKEVENYFRTKEGLPEELNLFPFHVTHQNRVAYIPKGLTLERVEKRGDRFLTLSYKDFAHYPPENAYMYLIYEYLCGQAKQNIRLRFTPSKPRIVIVFHNLPLPNTLITKSLQESQILNYLESKVKD